MKFLSTKEAGEKWSLSKRRVAILCAEGRIPDVQKTGNTMIPADAEKPADTSIKSGEYIKSKTAVYHKGYDVREPIEVRILPDRIEIISYPGADRSITEEGLRTYRVFNRRYRNRRIGEFLKEMHLTEGRNTGFRKILNALEHNGSPKPIFETDPERLSFTTTLFIHPAFLHPDEGRNEGRNSKEDMILELIRADSTITTATMVSLSGISRSSVERMLKSMKSKGIIARKGSTKKGSWIILK